MLLILLFACHTIDKINPESGGTGTADTCGGEIYVPLAGYDTTTPVLADAHADTYGAAPTPYHLHLSWGVGDPSTSMSFVWRTDYDTLATRVEYGIDTTYGSVAEGRSFGVGALTEYGRVHEVHACDLLPGTTYHYRVGGDGGWSEDHVFTTAPAPGSTEKFVFGVAGDARDNQETWQQLLAAMAQKGPDFLMFTGDAVDIGVNMDEWDAWLNAGAGVLEEIPVVLAHGNHEFQAQPFYALFAQPGNEQWFSFDYANAHLIVLNDTVAESGDKELQATWMQSDLAATTQPWRFAFHHIPAYSSCTTHGSNSELQSLWSPVEEAGGIAIDFAGHNHNYERSVPLYNGAEVSESEGTTYVVTAGAGADLYGNDLSQSFTAVAAVTEHYTIVEIEGGNLTLTAYDLAGNVIDTFTRSR